jgi:hypothetical protein
MAHALLLAVRAMYGSPSSSDDDLAIHSSPLVRVAVSVGRWLFNGEDTDARLARVIAIVREATDDEIAQVIARLTSSVLDELAGASKRGEPASTCQPAAIPDHT